MGDAVQGKQRGGTVAQPAGGVGIGRLRREALVGRGVDAKVKEVQPDYNKSWRGTAQRLRELVGDGGSARTRKRQIEDWACRLGPRRTFGIETDLGARVAEDQARRGHSSHARV